VLSSFRWEKDDRILISGQGCEDAVVLRFPSDKAMVQSLDFLTPMVNDPYAFGCIAASNALSDIYAMGGAPFSAMNIVCFPKDCLPLEVLSQILRGGQDTVLAAGAVMAGGHTVEDQELKFGLAVTGEADASRIAVNSGARAGDLLVLTKPIGTGILATAIKAKWANAQGLEQELVKWAGRLNSVGAQVIRDHRVQGATDVTGFGLGGHAMEMAKAAGVHIQVSAHAVPIMDHVLELAAMGLVPAGAYANKAHCQNALWIESEIDPILMDVIFDPQTSGGLLLAVPETSLAKVQADLRRQGDLAEVIGRVMPGSEYGVGLSLI
jgi:selenide,water dikinase